MKKKSDLYGKKDKIFDKKKQGTKKEKIKEKTARQYIVGYIHIYIYT